ncbi:Cellulose synthase-like protein G3 [Heracleum sosnowskyi]|uniref:Cellulose synthase-like protein G3 n=1 Tax=Heracleum sosnowskyi TaxID=360622 RepID=A0AAD8N6Z2_9APIA|nr:Cellulose synthase-like protein G3 [Heracleum sosnowskyi]
MSKGGISVDKMQPSGGVLHTKSAMRPTWLNRIFAATYLTSIFALLFHHCRNIISTTDSTTDRTTTSITIIMLVADLVLAFMWTTRQAFRMSPIRRQVFPENLTVEESEYPALDVFVCTADPYKEPPIGVVNTVLSLMAYDYPTEKLSVYVSDDGGSQLTLFALMEAAQFAKRWLPYCKDNNILDRSPEAYFTSHANFSPAKHNQIKVMYERMKMRISNVVKRGSIDGYVPDEEAPKVFAKWNSTPGFTSQNHPTIVQVIMETAIEKDNGNLMPNLVYVSREKSKFTFHNYKAGALNVLLRVSATMTNAPVVLTQDCDMFSNDPKTPLRALCYFTDSKMDPNLALVQFPQSFHGIDKDDIYSAELKDLIVHNGSGMDGLLGPSYMGSGAFFRRNIFFGGPGSYIPAQSSEISPRHVGNKSLNSEEVMTLAHRVAGCNFEAQTKWGSEIGFRYGSLVEDYNTGYRIQCQGWRSVFCTPVRPAFLGSSPITLHDMLNQSKRWCKGLLDVTFSKYNPLLFGVRYMKNFIQAICFGHYAFWPIWSIPLMIYSFLPQLCLINSSHDIFPKVTDPWLLLYVFLFLGSYAQELIEYVTYGSTAKRWWNNQRVWMMRSISSFPFALFEYIQERCGISSFGYNVTSKVLESEQSKRNAEGIFEFGVPSPLFVPITMAAIINLWALVRGMKLVILRNESLEDVFVQMFLSGFGVLNCWPMYEAMLLRKDKGKMPLKITLISTSLVWLVYLVSSSAF